MWKGDHFGINTSHNAPSEALEPPWRLKDGAPRSQYRASSFSDFSQSHPEPHIGPAQSAPFLPTVPRLCHGTTRLSRLSNEPTRRHTEEKRRSPVGKKP